MTAPVQVGPSPQGAGTAPYDDLDDYLADIGDRIRAERQARGWSIEHLANRIGVAKETVRRLENGSPVLLRQLVQACWALEVPLDHLLSDRWELPQRPVSLSLSPRQVDVLRAAEPGGSLAAIGARLGIDSHSVSAHLVRIYKRLDVGHVPLSERRTAAIRVAREHGLLRAA